MSPNHLLQKYHIGLSFKGWEVVATTKSSILKVRHVKRKFSIQKPVIHKRRTCDWFIAQLLQGLICERLTHGFINLFYVVEGHTNSPQN
jgi:hypothetical protein